SLRMPSRARSRSPALPGLPSRWSSIRSGLGHTSHSASVIAPPSAPAVGLPSDCRDKVAYLEDVVPLSRMTALPRQGSCRMPLTAAQIAQQQKQAEELLGTTPEKLGFAKAL